MRGTEFAELSAFVAVAERENFAKAVQVVGNEDRKAFNVLTVTALPAND